MANDRDLDRTPRPSPDSPPADEGAVADALRRAVAELVLDKAAEGIWLIDAEARTTFVNRRLADLLGYAEEEMIGKHAFAFIDPARWPIAERNLKQRELGVEDRQEVQLVRKDGTTVWALGSANPVFDRAGNYAGALAVLGDLTPQKRREDELRAEVQALRARLAGAERRVEGPAPESQPAFREPFRTAIVLATCGTFLTTVGLLTAGAVVASLFGIDAPPAGDL